MRHSLIICSRSKAGSMARTTWLSANLKSRQGLWVRRRLDVVSPGGNGARVAQDFFDQQRHE